MFQKYRATDVTNSGVMVRNTSGRLQAWNVQNLDSAAIYLKFYDASTTAGAVVGTSTPVYTLQIAANGSVNFRCQTERDPNFFTNGIAIGVVTGGADNNTTAAATLPIIELEHSP